MNPADLAMNARDVRDCHTLFLGREPEAQAVARYINVELGVFLGNLLQGVEFQEGVLTPLLLREPLPQERLMETPSLSLIDWVQRRLPIEPLSRVRVGAVRSWAHLLELLLSDRRLASLANTLGAAGIDQLLRERLDKSPLAGATRSVVGAIDSASALEIRGWALDLCDRSLSVRVEIYADNLFVGAATCNESRPELREEVGGEGRYGFTFQVPIARRSSFEGGRLLSVIDSVSRERIGVGTVVHADLTQGLELLSGTRGEIKQLRELLMRIESRLPDLGRLVSVPLDAYGDYWKRFYQLAPDRLMMQRLDAEAFAFAPLISIVLPTYNSDVMLLGKAIESVFAQSYGRWELILTDDASLPSDAIDQLLARNTHDPRVRYLGYHERTGVAGNTNRGITAATGDYLTFLEHDDELAPDALFEVVRTLQERRYALCYSDEDRIAEESLGEGTHYSPFFKPGFDLDLLRSMNYIGHLVVMRRDVLMASGGLRTNIEGAQNHDLLLRVTEQMDVAEIRHIPRILYHHRDTEGTVSRTPTSSAIIQDSVIAVVQAHLNRCGLRAEAKAHFDPFGASRAFATRVRWQLPTSAPAVSVIIPTRDRLDLLRPCIESIQGSSSSYPGPLEIIIVDNDSVDPATRRYLDQLRDTAASRVLRFSGEFNWSALNNAAVRDARGDVVIFLNNDTVVLSADWCTELTANALRPEVGAVGARLLYDDGTLQHAGVVLGVHGVADHESVGETPEYGGYFGRSHLQRSAAAVTGACLATRRALFLEMGGFDHAHLKVNFNDIDYCVRLRKAGYRVVFNPFAVLYHFESKSRGRDLSDVSLARQRREAAVFRSRWAEIVDSDPNYNPHFERYARPFTRLRAPP